MGPMTKPPIQDVEITEEPIRLGQFLKLSGIADDGGHARELLDEAGCRSTAGRRAVAARSYTPATWSLWGSSGPALSRTERCPQ